MSFRQSDEGTTRNLEEKRVEILRFTQNDKGNKIVIPTERQRSDEESQRKVETLHSFAATFNTKYILCLGNTQNDIKIKIEEQVTC